MARWTEARTQEVRGVLVDTLNERGGEIRGKGKDTTNQLYDLMPVDKRPGKGSWAGFLDRMERDGLLVLDQPSKYIVGVRVSDRLIKRPRRTVVEPETTVDEKIDAMEKILDRPEPESNGETGDIIDIVERDDEVQRMSDRIALLEAGGQAMVAEAQALQSRLGQLEEAGAMLTDSHVRAERDHLARQVKQLTKQLTSERESVERETRRRVKAEQEAERLGGQVKTLEHNLRTITTQKTRGGTTIREMLDDKTKRDLDRMMREIPVGAKS